MDAPAIYIDRTQLGRDEFAPIESHMPAYTNLYVDGMAPYYGGVYA